MIIDPGIGFAKTTEDNFEILRRLGELKSNFSNVMLLGASKKKFLRETVGEPTINGDIAVTTHAASQGVNIMRVHDVREIDQALKICEKLYY
jgi:dihydropteroate synthase